MLIRLEWDTYNMYLYFSKDLNDKSLNEGTPWS